MKDFLPLKVKGLTKSTSDCTVVEFEMPDNLIEDFAFKQGQYLTLRTLIDGEDIRRSYSLCSSPVDGKWQVGIKKVPEGKFSTYANETLRIGDEIKVMAPNGSFFVPVEETSTRNFVAFAAGSGITPIVSIIKTHLSKEPNATFKLFYANRTVSSIILKEELEALKNKFLGRLEIFYFLTQEQREIPLLNGRIDSEKLTEIFDQICDVSDIDHYFSCGPKEMIFTIKEFLENRGVDASKIHFELFNTGSKPKKHKPKKVKTDEHHTDVTVFEGGKSVNFKLEREGRSILEGGLAMGKDFPYACNGGVCCTCKAKLVEGTAEMKVNYALSQEEVDKGFILTCQAQPTSDKIVVDFDG